MRKPGLLHLSSRLIAVNDPPGAPAPEAPAPPDPAPPAPVPQHPPVRARDAPQSSFGAAHEAWSSKRRRRCFASRGSVSCIALT